MWFRRAWDVSVEMIQPFSNGCSIRTVRGGRIVVVNGVGGFLPQLAGLDHDAVLDAHVRDSLRVALVAMRLMRTPRSAA